MRPLFKGHDQKLIWINNPWKFFNNTFINTLGTSFFLFLFVFKIVFLFLILNLGMSFTNLLLQLCVSIFLNRY